MKKLGWLVCKTFIERKGGSSKKDLFSFLSPSLLKHIKDLEPPSSDLSEGFDFTSSLISSIHYSWFVPFLRTLPESDIRLFLSSLEGKTAQNLKEVLKISTPLIPLSKMAKEYFQEKLAEYFLIQTPDLVPKEALPPSDLHILLKLKPEELRLISEFLGLHDLAVELKQIIDTTRLKKIHSLLSKEKEYFLKILSHKKEIVIFKRMELARWDGTSQPLLTLIFQRGMNRLSKALYLSDPNFIWYIKHQMTEEEATLFSSLHKSLEHPKAYSILAGQILEVISFLQKINPSIGT